MARRIVLFGATGYTGGLTAAALLRAGVRPVLAGRSHQSLAALGVRLGKGLDTALADVARPESLLELVQPGDVLISTVGPFVRYGRAVVEAAIYRRATYLDTCGEPPFIRSVFQDLFPIADQAGVALLTAFAFEYVPGQLAAALALDALPEATRVDVGYFIGGGYRGGSISGGTRASLGSVALVPHYAWRDGALRSATSAGRVRSFAFDGSEHYAFTLAGAEHFAVPRIAPHIRDVNVYVGSGRGKRRTRASARFIAAASHVPGMRRAYEAMASLRPRRGGPDEMRRAASGSDVVALAYDEAGRELRRVHLRGANVYEFTASILAWGAARASQDDVERTGALGAVEAFGLGPLRDAAEAAGLAVVEE